MTTADRCANVAGMQQIGRLKHQGSMRRSSCRHAISHRPGDAVRATSNIACCKNSGHGCRLQSVCLYRSAERQFIHCAAERVGNLAVQPIAWSDVKRIEWDQSPIFKLDL